MVRWIPTRIRFRGAVAPVAAAVLAGTAAVSSAGVVNGDFEHGPLGWKVVVDTTEADRPHVVDGMNLPDPPGVDLRRRHLALVGDLGDTPAPAANPSILFARFDSRGEADAAFTTVAFDAAWWRCGDDEAAVVVTTPDGPRAFRIPPARGPRSGRIVVSAPGNGRGVLEFVVWSPSGRAPRSLLAVDNVAVFATPTAETVPEAAPLRVDTVPRAAGPGRHAIEAFLGMAPRDCNADGIPDGIEACRDPRLDRDGDGMPDDCEGRGRRINWTLLVMGLAVLVPTILRMTASARRRNRI